MSIPFSKSFEVHSFLHVFPRQNTSKNYFLETVCKVAFILFFFPKPRKKVPCKANDAADLLSWKLSAAVNTFALCRAPARAVCGSGGRREHGAAQALREPSAQLRAAPTAQSQETGDKDSGLLEGKCLEGFVPPLSILRDRSFP